MPNFDKGLLRQYLGMISVPGLNVSVMYLFAKLSYSITTGVYNIITTEHVHTF